MSHTSSAVWLISGVINVLATVENSFKYTESVNIMMQMLGNDIIYKTNVTNWYIYLHIHG